MTNKNYTHEIIFHFIFIPDTGFFDFLHLAIENTQKWKTNPI